MKVLGLDIVRGSPLSRITPPRYSIIIINSNGKIIYESPEVSLSTIVKLAWEYSIDRIGLDNIYELASTPRDVAKILSLFPSHTEIYQVTLDNNTFTDLLVQAAKLGINVPHKPTPLQTAYLCALIALHGLGTPIKGLERKTKIVISRAKSVGPGGSSSNRYARGMRTAILKAVKEIKSMLEKEKLDYDLVIRKGLGGFDSAIFTVYADTGAVKKIIKPYTGKDMRIVLRPIYSGIVTIPSSDEKRRKIIVGIDPGIETGIALIDLSLNILLLESSKNLDKIEIVNKIYSHGLPVLVAVDTNPPPENAKKLASILGAPLYVPSESLSTEVKDRLIEWLKKRKLADILISTSHERDALAAAIKAYKSYEKKLVELERKLLELDLDVDLDELKSMVLKGKNISEVIEYAIEKHLENLENPIEDYSTTSLGNNLKKQKLEYGEKIKNLQSKLLELEKENEGLKLRLRELENKINELAFEKKFQNLNRLDFDVYRDRSLAILREQIKQLQNTITLLKNDIEKATIEKNELINTLYRIASGEYLCLPRIRRITTSELNNLKNVALASKILIVSEDIISIEVIDLLKHCKLLLLFEKCSEEVKQLLLKNGIAAQCGIKIDYVFDNFVLIHKDVLEQEIANAVNALYSFNNKHRPLTLTDVIKIISEYRDNVLFKSNRDS